MSSFKFFTFLYSLSLLIGYQSYAKEYCDYEVKEGDSLELILTNYLKTKNYTEKQIVDRIYSSDGELTEVRALNNIQSINRLYPGQIIKIPCDWMAKDKKEYELEASSKLFARLISSDDIINNTKGDIFLFPVTGMGISAKRELSDGYTLRAFLDFDFGVIDKPDNARTLTKSAFFNKHIGLDLGHKLDDDKIHFSLTRRESLFFKAENSTSVLIDTYHYLLAEFKYIRSYGEWGNLYALLGYNFSALASDEFEKGLRLGMRFETEIHFILKMKVGPEIIYETLNTIHEEQKNYTVGVWASTDL